MSKSRQQALLDARIKDVLASQGTTGGVPLQRGLIRNVMLFCQRYQGRHPMLLSVQARMANNPGWRPTYSYARTLKDVIDKLGRYATPIEEHHKGPTSLDP